PSRWLREACQTTIQQIMHCESRIKQFEINLHPPKYSLIRQIPWRPVLLALFCCLAANPGHGAAAAGKMLKVTTKVIDGVTHFYVQNLEAADVTATFDMKLVNLKCSQPLPFTATIGGKQTVEAFTVCAIKAK